MLTAAEARFLETRTRIPFGRSAIDDAERDEVRIGQRCRFALDDNLPPNAAKMAKLVLEEVD
jgi:hypothetical protein